MLSLFHDKKCCNCFNFVHCILWDFIVLGLVLSWWRIEHEIKNQCSFVISSWEGFSWKGHIRSTCWKLKSHASLKDFASVSRVRPSHEIPAKFFAWRIFKCDFLTLHPYYIYTLIIHKSMKSHSERKTLDRFFTTHTPIFERESYSSLVRNHYSFFFFPLPVLYLERRFVPEHNSHLIRV